MNRNMLNSVRDGGCIFANNDNVLICAKKLWLFRSNGEFVVKLKSIRHPSKVAFLPNETALIDADDSFHYISLYDGTILWTSIKKGRRMRESFRFAVSSDGEWVFSQCYLQSGELKIDRICPKNFYHDSYVSRDSLRVTHDIFCDKEDIPCVIQSHFININADIYLPTGTIQNGIVAFPFSEDKPTQHWIRRWVSEKVNNRCIRASNGRYILYSDLFIFDLLLNDGFYLLNLEERASLPIDMFDVSYQSDQNLLFLYYIGKKINIIIDCETRKIISKYVLDSNDCGYIGCLIKNEFWIATNKGIQRMPFPNM